MFPDEGRSLINEEPKAVGLRERLKVLVGGKK
jgi:hypothetical protein